MPYFKFEGKNKEGKVIKGTVEAGGRDQAVKILRERSIVVVSLEEKGTSFFGKVTAPLGKFSRIKEDQIVVFTRQLSTMISAGLPLAQALTLLQSQARSAKFKELLKEASAILEGGAPLSKAFEAHPDVFDPLYINLVKAGESSGALDKIFERLADKYEQRKEFRAKTKGAMIYPAIIFFGMVGVMALMLLFVVPKVTSMYSSMELELPLPTKILIGVSNAALEGWWVMILGVVLVVAGLKKFRATRQGEYFFAKLSFKIPIIGRVAMNSDLVEITSTLGLLMSSGVPITEALEIVSGSVKNKLYKDVISHSIAGVKKGASLSSSFGKSTYIPPIVPQMLAVGEETGKADEILFKMADYFQAETDQVVKNLSTAIEPVVLVMLGVMVGVMVLAIIMPIYKLTSAFE